MSYEQTNFSKTKIVNQINQTALEAVMIQKEDADISYTTYDINKKGEETAVNGSSIANNGIVNVYEDGIVTGVIINGGGIVNVYSSGVASNTTVNLNGELLLSNGGTAIGTKVNKNGLTYVSKGGIAASTTVIDGGLMKVFNGGTANSVTISSDGLIEVLSGGNTSNVKLDTYGSAVISSGGYVSQVNVNKDGELYIDGGNVQNLYVSNDGYVYNEGFTSNVTVEGDGYFILSSGAEHQGTLNIREGAVVSAYRGSEINFTIEDLIVSEYLINDISLIQGDINYSITVPVNVKGGIYVLAQEGAEKFNKTITVYNSRVIDSVNTLYDNIGTLTMSTPVSSGNMTYCLKKDGGSLSLYVKDNRFVETKVGNFSNNCHVFELTKDGIGTLYAENREYVLSGSIDTSTWQIVGVGDFDGDGIDGLLWQDVKYGTVYAQNDMTCFDEINNRTNLVGIVEDGYSIIGTGDFSNTDIDGVLLQSPAFGDKSVSVNYGLPVWAKNTDGATFNGWLGALVNTWDDGDQLQGNVNNLEEINGLNYRFELIGTGDFNGDGTDDVILKNTMPEFVHGVEITGSGDIFTFLTGSNEDIAAGADPTVVYTGCVTGDWDIIGTGDFNGDGTDDMLVSDGVTVCGWEIEYGVRISDDIFGKLKDGEQIIGVTDFNNDGTDDIVIRNSVSGDKNIWYIQDGTVEKSCTIAVA